jgi:hypothetical protein
MVFIKNFDEFSHPARLRKLQNDAKKIMPIRFPHNVAVEVPASAARVGDFASTACVFPKPRNGQRNRNTIWILVSRILPPAV